MSDQVPESTPSDSVNPAQDPKESEVDWKAKSREWERRAKENKSAADELAALRDSQKTSEQRAEERVAELERKAAVAEAKALRSDIAAKYGLSPEDRDLFLTGTDESTLSAQAQRLAGREEDRKKQGNFAPKEGTTPAGSSNTDERDFVRNLFSRAAD
jgi:hypothetical protein